MENKLYQKVIYGENYFQDIKTKEKFDYLFNKTNLVNKNKYEIGTIVEVDTNLGWSEPYMYIGNNNFLHIGNQKIINESSITILNIIGSSFGLKDILYWIGKYKGDGVCSTCGNINAQKNYGEYECNGENCYGIIYDLDDIVKKIWEFAGYTIEDKISPLLNNEKLKKHKLIIDFLYKIAILKEKN